MFATCKIEAMREGLLLALKLVYVHVCMGVCEGVCQVGRTFQ